MNRYRCTIYEYDYTFADNEDWFSPEHVPACRVASVVVSARHRREAAARAYVGTIGRARAAQLRALKAPASCILPEIHWRMLAKNLSKASNWLGNCFVYDNLVVAFYLRVEKLPPSYLVVDVVKRRAQRQARRLRAARFPSRN